MNILITGASGFIGSTLLKKLSNDKRYKILTLNRKFFFNKSCKNIQNLKSDLNLSSPSLSLIKAFSPEIIIHLSCQNIPEYSKKTSQINLKVLKHQFKTIGFHSFQGLVNQ